MSTQGHQHGIGPGRTSQGTFGLGRRRASQSRIGNAHEEPTAHASHTATLPSAVIARHWHVPSAYGLIHQDHDLRLWLALADGRVLVFRLHGRRDPDDALIAPIAAAVADDLRGMLIAFDVADAVPVSLLYAAPVEPPAPQAPYREAAASAADRAAIMACVDRDALRLLADLERRDHNPVFYRSVRNHNRLAVLSPELRLRRMQALLRFPGLVVPLLLTGHQTCNLHDGRRHAMRRPAPQVAAAIDGGRDLAGALAHEYGISRSLVRSSLNAAWWPMADRNRRLLLRMFDAIPAPRRPRDPEPIVRHWYTLSSIIRLLGYAEDVPPPLNAAALAGAFRHGVTETLDALAARHEVPAHAIDDAVDFLAAAARRADVHLCGHHAVSWRRLGETWLAHYGLLALVDASLAWHQRRPWTSASPAVGATPSLVLPAVIARLQADDADAVELLTEHDLVVEGQQMHHCVADYWPRCIGGDRIVRLTVGNGERATTHLRPRRTDAGPSYVLAQLRGKCNQPASATMLAWAQVVINAINLPERLDLRIAACPHDAAPAGRADDAGARPPWPADVVDLHAPAEPPLQRRDEARLLRCLARMGYLPALPGRVLLTAIAGWARHGGRAAIDLSAGQPLDLVREPANPQDALAVRIEHEGALLGYIPRSVNADIAATLARGEPLLARVERIDPHAPSWERVRVEIVDRP